MCVGAGGGGGRMYSSVTPEWKMYRWFDQNTILRRGKSNTMSTYAVSECGCGVWWGGGGWRGVRWRCVCGMCCSVRHSTGKCTGGSIQTEP